ncbi:MAG: hypothetical protein JW891_18240 [Candidatus Lokiarchaeota archaeon]|nr:hypothetical protein [Candidatus Lokiarchaeota archaeon]
MPFTIKNIIVSRLFVLLAIFVVPVAIFLIFNVTDFSVWWSNDPVLSAIIVKFLTPLTYAVSWFYFLILFANRFADTIDSMEKHTNIIPLRLKIFYGINALFVLFVFVFPLITPLVSILSFASMMWQLTTFKKSNWDEKQKVPLITKILAVAAAILPIFCTASIAPDYLELPIYLFQSVWVPLLDLVMIFSYCLCTALAIGSLLVLFANNGVSEYEQLWSDPKRDQTMLYIAILEILITIGLMVLAYANELTGNYPIIDLFYNLGFVIVLIVSIVNFFTGKSKNKKFRSHLLGYILAAVFMGSNLFIYDIELTIVSEWVRVISLNVLATVFIAVFLYTFVKMEESEF